MYVSVSLVGTVLCFHIGVSCARGTFVYMHWLNSHLLTKVYYLSQELPSSGRSRIQWWTEQPFLSNFPIHSLSSLQSTGYAIRIGLRPRTYFSNRCFNATLQKHKQTLPVSNSSRQCTSQDEFVISETRTTMPIKVTSSHPNYGHPSRNTNDGRWRQRHCLRCCLHRDKTLCRNIVRLCAGWKISISN